MRWIKLISTIFLAQFRKRITPGERTTVTFRVWITDIDIAYMNNSAILTVLEMGRLDFMVRLGFFKLARKNKWYFPSRSINVQFWKPLKFAERATVVTKIFHLNSKWIYLEQKIITSKGEVAHCIVKCVVKKGRETISPNNILAALGFESFLSDKPELIQLYEREDQMVRTSMSHRF